MFNLGIDRIYKCPIMLDFPEFFLVIGTRSCLLSADSGYPVLYGVNIVLSLR